MAERIGNTHPVSVKITYLLLVIERNKLVMLKDLDSIEKLERSNYDVAETACLDFLLTNNCVDRSI